MEITCDIFGEPCRGRGGTGSRKLGRPAHRGGRLAHLAQQGAQPRSGLIPKLSTQIRQTADPLPQTDRCSAFFAEWVCTLATTSPQVAASPPPNKGHCIIRDRTRRRNADSLLQMRRNPHHSRCGGHRKTGGHGCGARGRRRGLAAAPRSDGRHTYTKSRT